MIYLFGDKFPIVPYGLYSTLCVIAKGASYPVVTDMSAEKKYNENYLIFLALSSIIKARTHGHTPLSLGSVLELALEYADSCADL